MPQFHLNSADCVDVSNPGLCTFHLPNRIDLNAANATMELTQASLINPLMSIRKDYNDQVSYRFHNATYDVTAVWTIPPGVYTPYQIRDAFNAHIAAETSSSIAPVYYNVNSLSLSINQFGDVLTFYPIAQDAYRQLGVYLDYPTVTAVMDFPLPLFLHESLYMDVLVLNMATTQFTSNPTINNVLARIQVDVDHGTIINYESKKRNLIPIYPGAFNSIQLIVVNDMGVPIPFPRNWNITYTINIETELLSS